ncbi:polysaccharide biosynthesis tyrosine autokinase [Phormidium sp. CLA17]|uniref:GumC family protein n=1 Tax=Leptolyngbya sp. Cla-17 TaxID=2803751 RepID=UPI001491F38E|nr:tyrosine-protein kinase domain-containing protein [Leptolyngbya sp. Cla-17]MBM0742513.1 polysaccharide biosynthesis tyrosine autokinase [Leptolyngbya sp. Cla-17]
MQTGQNAQNLNFNRQSRLEEASAPPSDGSGEADQKPKSGGFKVRSLMGAVRRNIPTILVLTLLGGAGGWVLTRTFPLIYEGSFAVLVEPITSQGRLSDPSAISRSQVQQDSNGNGIDYPTLLQVLQSPDRLSKISKTIQSRYPEVTAESLARDLKNQNFTVTRIGTNLLDSTRTIEVDYRGSNPEKVRFILEQLAQGYLKFSLDDRKVRTEAGVEFIEEQLPTLQQRVTVLEGQMQALKQQYRLTDPALESNQVSEQLKNVNEKKLEADTLLREQTTLYSVLQKQLGFTPTQALGAASLSQNPRYQDLLTQLKKTEGLIAVKLARFNEDSPIVKSLRDQQRNLARLIAQEAQLNLNESSPGVSESSQVLAFQDPVRLDLIKQLVQSANLSQSLQVRVQETARNKAALEERLNQLPAITRQYNTLQQQLDIATKTLNQFLLQRETFRVEAAQKEVPWEIIAQPKLVTDLETGKPIASRGKKAQPMIPGGLLAGALLGVAAALLREKIRNRFVTAADLQDAVPFPLLGMIPSQKTGLPLAANGTQSKISEPFTDAFCSLYTNLRFLCHPPVRSLVVGSVEPGDGKTTVALNLALMASTMGHRVLLVDANLCLPQLHTHLNLPNQKGLIDVLQQRIDASEVIEKIPGESNLSVLTAGSAQFGATRLLASNEMQRLVERLQSSYDLVIYDSPSLSASTDSNFLTAQTDGLLLVVSLNKTKQSLVKETLSDLEKYRLPVVGVVANRIGKSKIVPYALPTSQQQTYATEAHPAFFGKLKESGDVGR